MSNYKRKAFGPYTIETVTDETNRVQIIAHPSKLAKGNGGYDYDINLFEELTPEFIGRCAEHELEVTRKYIRLSEGKSVKAKYEGLAVDALKRRLPETIEFVK
jgi:hypothetical protein